MSRPGCSCIGVFADKLSGRVSRKGAGDANGAEGETRQLTVVAVIWPRPSPMHRLARKVLANTGRSSAASRISAVQTTYGGGL